MKKILAIILAAALAVSMAACSKKTDEPVNADGVQPAVSAEPTPAPEQTPESQQTLAPSEEPKETPAAPSATPTPQQTPTPEQTPTPQPSTTPSVTPEEPTPAPVPTPAPEPAPSGTVAGKLLAEFKGKASSSASALSIAETLISNPILPFNGGAMEVEEGYLTGFDNTEIKGFKEGAMFAPMIGTIPFVGYIFTLEDAASAPAFIANLKSAANLRWNICVSADEMVAGSVGNKVFFVMSPTSFEQ